LFRQEIIRLVRPPAAQVRTPELEPPGIAGPSALARARDKVDSLHGWRADSVVLSAAEMGSLVMDGLSRDARRHLDSLTVTLGEGRVTVAALLETAAIPPDQLGPLAGALDPWERVSATGVLAVTRPGFAEWRVDSLTLRGFTLPAQASRQLLGRALAGAGDGVVPLALPRGIAALHIRPAGVALFREESR
jgi:hypothetical protein